MRRARLLVLLTALATGACSPAIAVRRAGHCDPPTHAMFQFDPDPQQPKEAPRDAHLAALLGLHSVLEERKSGELSVDLRLRVVERIELARLAVAAASAELSCESERSDQTADYLGHKGSGTVQTLTVASIGVAAATAIVSVFLSTNNSSAALQDSVAIGGGVVTGGLGLSSLWVHPEISYAHPRNLLGEVWRGPKTTTLYSPFVWAYLTRREFSNAQDLSIREKIIDRWKRYQRVERNPAEAAILFGTGGLYDAGMLRTRSQMLDEVEAEVSLVNQDLEVLMSELTR